jgi:hypothetical protein
VYVEADRTLPLSACCLHFGDGLWKSSTHFVDNLAVASEPELAHFSHSTPVSRSVFKFPTRIFLMRSAYSDHNIHYIQHTQQCRKTRVSSPCDGHER